MAAALGAANDGDVSLGAPPNGVLLPSERLVRSAAQRPDPHSPDTGPAGTGGVTRVPTQWGIHEDVYCAVSHGGGRPAWWIQL